MKKSSNDVPFETTVALTADDLALIDGGDSQAAAPSSESAECPPMQPGYPSQPAYPSRPVYTAPVVRPPVAYPPPTICQPAPYYPYPVVGGFWYW